LQKNLTTVLPLYYIFQLKKLSRTTSALTKEVSKQKEFLIASDGHFRHLIALLL